MTFTYTVPYQAAVFAQACHGRINQKRRYTGEDYFIHPESVARTVADLNNTQEVVAAAFLHDVVEDVPTPVLRKIAQERYATAVLSDFIINSSECGREASLLILEELFGKTITSLVEQVTDVSELEEGNRAFRKNKDKNHLALATPEGQTIKLADLLDNTYLIIEHAKHPFVLLYMKEKRDLLEVLKDGDPTLYSRAQKVVTDFWINEEKKNQ